MNVNDSPDVKKLRQMAMDLGFGLTMRCMEETSKEMKAKGKTDEEIGAALSDQSKQGAMREKCLCKFKGETREALSDLDIVLKKHPDWKGKTLVIKEKGSTEKISVQELEEIKNKISGCS